MKTARKTRRTFSLRRRVLSVIRRAELAAYRQGRKS